MANSKKSGSNFLVQGSILAIASIVSRIIGLIYRIPMTNTIGDLGNSYYGSAFEVYNIMLIISSYSLPLAVSKLVSAQMAQKKTRMVFQIFKGALLFAVVSGAIASLVVFFGARFFSDVLLNRPNSVFALRVLAPTLLIVAVLGVFRGLFQGMGTMIPSAVSQILEQIVNAVVSVVAAILLFGYGSRIGAVLGDEAHYAAAYGAAGGTLGTNLGAVAALLFVLFVFALYMTVFRRQMKRDRHKTVEPFSQTMKMLLLTILPVLLSTTIYNISGFLDNIVYTHIATNQGYFSDDIDVWWGVFTGKYKLLINVPISIASAMAASSVPALTAAYGKGQMNEVRQKLSSVIRFVMMIAIPSAVGLAVLARPIFLLLFPSTAETVDTASFMMYIGSSAVVFYCLSTLSNGLLQGINRMAVPVINAVVALVAHILLLVVLMLFFKLNIYAVVIANIFFALLMCVLNAWALYRYSGYKQEWLRTFLLPCGCSLVMGVAAFFTYKGLFAITESNVVSVCIAILIAVLVYGVAMILLGGITEKELNRIPLVGKPIARLLQKIPFLNR